MAKTVKGFGINIRKAYLIELTNVNKLFAVEFTDNHLPTLRSRLVNRVLAFSGESTVVLILRG